MRLMLYKDRRCPNRVVWYVKCLGVYRTFFSLRFLYHLASWALSSLCNNSNKCHRVCINSNSSNYINKNCNRNKCVIINFRCSNSSK